MRRPLLLTLAVALGGVTVAAASAPAQAAVTISPGALPGDTAVGTYYPITKNQRILDTRTTLGGHHGVLGPNSELALQVGGVAGVPAGAAASAAVVNLTAVAPTSTTYLTAYPSGGTRPTVSSINVAAKKVRANLVTVPLGADGKIRIYNQRGSVNVIVDVMGFFAKDDIQGTHGVGNMYEPTTPHRLFDSRTDPDFPGQLYPGDGFYLGVNFGAELNDDVRGYAINITAIKPSATGYLVAWDGSDPMPLASSINFTAGQVVPNMAFVPAIPDSTDPDGTAYFGLVNNSSTARTHVAVDVVGVYVANQTEGYRFEPLAPTRVVDTRSGLGGVQGAIGANQARTYTAPSSVAGDSTGFLVGNATGITPTTATYMTISESGVERPNVSNLNLATGEVAANAAVVPLAEGNLFDVYNSLGSVDFALDVAGALNWYELPQPEGFAAASGGFDASGGTVQIQRR
jgi:hypothetical protein